MAGRFAGLSDLEWRLFEDIFPPAPLKRGRGMPHVPFRNVLNTLLSILITDCRWCDVPRGPQWASKSATHRWLQRWQADGTLTVMQARIQRIVEERGMIHWDYGTADGAVSLWAGWRRWHCPRRQGQGRLIQRCTDGSGMPSAHRFTGPSAQTPQGHRDDSRGGGESAV